MYANVLNNRKDIQSGILENCELLQMAFSFLRDKQLMMNIKSVDNKYGGVAS